MHIVVVGYGAAGLTAASYARLINRQARVTVFEKRRYAIYHPCSLPDVIAGVIPAERLVEEAVNLPNLDVRTATVVEEVDTASRRVYVRDLRDGKKVDLEYDALILATGSRPFIPRSVKIEDSRGIYTLRTLEDSKLIAGAANRHPSAVVVGGSALGVEVAHALRKRGIKVTLIEYAPRLLPGKLDEEIAKIVEDHLRGEGVEVIIGDGVSEITGAEGNKRLTTNSGKVVETGFVVMATGVKPENELALQMGLRIGMTGGVIVDERMRTNIENVYAAGDIAEVKDLVTGNLVLSPFASTALIMGRVAGINAAGGEAKLKGVLQNWIVNLDGFKFGAVGVTEEVAQQSRFETVSVTVSTQDKPSFYPDSASVTLKLVVEADEGRLLGAQVAGFGNLVEKLNVISTIVTHGVKVYDIPYLEFAYTPSLNELVHPLYVAADAALRKMSRRHAR
ncbi:MAG: FAD-dependent oxidoreductase [Thermofilaceae archaeon]|nr:FAD-dependent oxidoreductase [Thermofilaceae archaeon]